MSKKSSNTTIILAGISLAKQIFGWRKERMKNRKLNIKKDIFKRRRGKSSRKSLTVIPVFLGVGALMGYFAKRGHLSERIEVTRVMNQDTKKLPVEVAKESISALKEGGLDTQKHIIDNAKDRVNTELHTKVIDPAKSAAIKYGSLAFIALTIYLISVVIISGLILDWILG